MKYFMRKKVSNFVFGIAYINFGFDSIQNKFMFMTSFICF